MGLFAINSDHCVCNFVRHLEYIDIFKNVFKKVFSVHWL